MPAPTVTSVSIVNGPAGSPSGVGATPVSISGSGFADATAVNFGSIAAASFAVQNDSSIIAVAPAVLTSGVVDITVVNPDGTSPTSSADQFTTVPVLPPYASFIASAGLVAQLQNEVAAARVIPAFDAAATGNGTGSASVPLTLGATASLLVVAVVVDNTSGPSGAAVTVTCGSDAMSGLGAVEIDDGPAFGELFVLLSPPVGDQSIEVHVSPSTGTLGVAAVSYSGVTSYGSLISNSGTGTESSVAIPTSADALAFAAYFGSYGLASGSGTLRASGNDPGYMAVDAQDEPGTGGTVTVTGTTVNSDTWLMFGLALS